MVGYGEIDPSIPKPAVYETIELVFEVRRSDRDPFREFLQFEFWKDAERHQAEGFFDGHSSDGDRLYRVRFMVTEPGTWHYEWSIGDRHGSKDLVVEREPDNHGHVHASSDGVLRHDDGGVHYWFGGKSFTANNYGPFSKGWEDNTIPPEASPYDTRYSDDQVRGYLDLMDAHEHNGTRLKIALYPLQGDGFGWDLEWIHRAEDWIRMMQERHIYCQVSFFDAHSRRNDRWFEGHDDPRKHVFNAWQADEDNEDDDNDEADKKKNYVRTIVARFAGFWNVYWELANDVDRPGSEAADQFVAASQQYLEWLEDYDPYDLAVGASASSQEQWNETDIDFLRTEDLQTDGPARAVLWNEMVGDCSAEGEVESGDSDLAIRDPAYRHCYRAAIWRAFVTGAYGASTASWLDLSGALPNVPPVVKVMRDHNKFRTKVMTDLLGVLDLGPDELEPDPDFVSLADGSDLNLIGTRSKPGQVYVSYFSPGGGGDKVSLQLPPGNYSYRWLNPRDIVDGEAEDHENEQPVRDEGPTTIETSGSVTIDRPMYDDDLVLLVQPPSDGIE